MSKKYSDIASTYEDIPYESYAHPMSSPAHAMMLATLFGMSPARLESARVLELGCAGGGNLIPHAVNYPKGKFVGIDLSQSHIESAKEIAEKIGLKNIEFHCKSITDLKKPKEKFDYIIVHGVISWVPVDVQDKIFEICAQHLAPNGVSYISYNALPGWNVARNIRDMMLYHSKNFEKPTDKIKQSRLFLDFIADALKDIETPYAKIIGREAESLKKHSDHYIYHDHLEHNNTQFYFSDFIKKASQAGLQYLAECHLQRMYVGNMPKKAADKLKDIGDVVRTEQYMDFITNRRFRSTLLCHKDVKINRNIKNEDVKRFSLLANIVPEKNLQDINIEDTSETIKFACKGRVETSISTSSPMMKAILYSFVQTAKNPMSFKEIITSANRLLKGNRIGDLEKELIANAMRLVLQGAMQMTMLPRRKSNLTKPAISKLARYQAGEGAKPFVTNMLHETIRISDFEKLAFQYMDGKNDVQAIESKVTEDISGGQMSLEIEGKKVTSKEKIAEYVKNALSSAIARANAAGILV